MKNKQLLTKRVIDTYDHISVTYSFNFIHVKVLQN